MEEVLDASNAEWITIHPGNSEKGVHIQVDDKGKAVGGNPHLVAALNGEKSAESGTETVPDGAIGEFSAPSEGDFGDLLDWVQPKEEDFSDILGSGETEQTVKSATFTDHMKALNFNTATVFIKGTMKTCFSDYLEYAKTRFSITDDNRASKVVKKHGILKGTPSSRKASTVRFAATLKTLIPRLKDGAIDFSSLQFNPTRSKYGLSSYSLITNGYHIFGKTMDVPGCINFSPTEEEYLKKQDKDRKELAIDPKRSPFHAQSRFPAENADYMLACHEIAHYAYDSKNMKHAWNEVVQAVEGKDGFTFKGNVSRYAWYDKYSYSKKINEAHSECFAMIANPEYKHGMLPKAVEDYFYNNYFKAAEG